MLDQEFVFLTFLTHAASWSPQWHECFSNRCLSTGNFPTRRRKHADPKVQFFLFYLCGLGGGIGRGPRVPWHSPQRTRYQASPSKEEGCSVQYSNLALQLETAQLYAVDVEVGEQAFWSAMPPAVWLKDIRALLLLFSFRIPATDVVHPMSSLSMSDIWAARNSSKTNKGEHTANVLTITFKTRQTAVHKIKTRAWKLHPSNKYVINSPHGWRGEWSIYILKSKQQQQQQQQRLSGSLSYVGFQCL